MSNKFFAVLVILGCVGPGASTAMEVIAETRESATEVAGPSYADLIDKADRIISEHKPEALERFSELIRSVEDAKNWGLGENGSSISVVMHAETNIGTMSCTGSPKSVQHLLSNPQYGRHVVGAIIVEFLQKEFGSVEGVTDQIQSSFGGRNYLRFELVPAGGAVTKAFYHPIGSFDQSKQLTDPWFLIYDVGGEVELETAIANGTFIADLPWAELDIVMIHAGYIVSLNENIRSIHSMARIAMTNPSNMQPTKDCYGEEVVFWANHPDAGKILAAIFHGALKEQGLVPAELMETFNCRPNMLFGSDDIQYLTDNGTWTRGTRLEFLEKGYLPAKSKNSDGCFGDLLRYSELIISIGKQSQGIFEQ